MDIRPSTVSETNWREKGCSSRKMSCRTVKTGRLFPGGVRFYDASGEGPAASFPAGPAMRGGGHELSEKSTLPVSLL